MINLEKDYSKLIPAPIDNKNIMEDWIEEVFDEQSALIHKGKHIGFINGVPFYCYINRHSNNMLLWFLVNGGYDNTDEERRTAIAELKRRLQEKDEDNEEYGIKVEYYDVALLGLHQSFYFVDED